MAIRNVADFRRLARAGVWLLAGILPFCVAAVGQAPTVTTGSVVTIPSSNTWGQVYKILFFKGNVLALDAANDALYQLAPGATSWTTIVSPKTTLGNGYTAQGMTMDAQGTIYITISYVLSTVPNALFWRVPYNASQNTWSVTTSDAWGGNILDPNSGNAIVTESDNTVEAFFQNSSKMDGSGTLYWESTTSNQIFSVPVDKNGNDPNQSYVATSIVTGLKAGQGKIAVDVNGNVYFVEYHYLKNSARDTGIWFIPAGKTGLTGVAQLTRIDASQASNPNPVAYAGVTLDAAGNIYLTSEQNSSVDEVINGTWMIPNECGSPTKVNATCYPNYNHISMLAPVGGNNPLSIDSRGYLWIPSYQQSFPPSSENGPWPGIYGIVVWAPGVLNLSNSVSNFPSGPSATGQAGTAGILFYTFNQGLTLDANAADYSFSSATGGASQFAVTATNPLAPTGSSTTPVSACDATASAAFTTQNWCELWVTLNATAPGAASSQLILSSNGSPVPGSTVYVTGIGQGAGASLLNSPQLTTLGTGLKTPAQVASDVKGDTWVADPGNKQVLYFPAGSSSTTAGTSIGTGLSSPTGVALDGSGDVYIADSGSGTVYEIPWVANSSGGGAYGAQTTLATGFGTSGLNLAADGSANVYVADPQNARVVRIPSPAASNLIPNNNAAGMATPTTITIGSGFTAPSAVAVDSSGDVYIADSGNLFEVSVPPLSAQTEVVTGTLSGVTGLAVDASGSVIVAESGGLYRIPAVGGVLTVNSAGPLDNTVNLPGDTTASITSPVGVAVDQQGNMYVTDMTSGPNLYELGVKGFVDLGNSLSPGVLSEDDVPVFNIGNAPLNVTSASIDSGTDSADFSITTPSGGTPCYSNSGPTPVLAGGSCTIGVGLTGPIPVVTPGEPPPPPTTYTGSMTIQTAAVNVSGGTLSANLSGTVLAGLENTQTTVSFNPASSTFPGSTTATVTVTPEPGSGISYPNNIPTGAVTLTLTNSAPGSTQAPIVQQGTATGTTPGGSTTVTFALTGLPGAAYNVTAAYAGNPAQLFQKSTGTATFTVSPAAPTVTLSEPQGISPNSTNGAYYVLYQGLSTLTINVSSSLGSPTGTVTLMNGSQSVGTATYTQNQIWTFATGSLPTGTYNLTAVYGGDQNFAQTTSSAISFQVIPSSVLLTASPSSVSTKAGTPVTSTITIQSLVGFSATAGATITCELAPVDTVPPDAECTFSNPQPIICAPPGTSSNPCSGITSTVVTLSSNIPVNIPTSARNAPKEGPHSSPLILAGVFGLGLLGLALRRKKIFNRYLANFVCLVLLFAGVMMGITSCTNSSYSTPPKVPVYTTKSGTYNVGIVVLNPLTGQPASLPFTLSVTIQ